MTVYVCLHCEYRFDTEKGDPAYNIPAGATPADMPDDWVCPECAALGIEHSSLKKNKKIFFNFLFLKTIFSIKIL